MQKRERWSYDQIRDAATGIRANLPRIDLVDDIVRRIEEAGYDPRVVVLSILDSVGPIFYEVAAKLGGCGETDLWAPFEYIPGYGITPWIIKANLQRPCEADQNLLIFLVFFPPTS